MRLDISWYNQFSSKRTKGVIFNSTGEERWGGKAISKYTITSQTETSNPNITRHAQHQRQIKIENKWRETTSHKLVLGRKDRGGFLQNSQPCNNLVSNTLVAKGSWPTQLPCNKHIFCHSNSDVNTICANFNSVRCYKAPLIISGLSAKLHGKPAIFVIMMFLQKISMRKWETFTLGGP